MRTLSFIVDGLIINKNPDCDFSDLVPGTTGYLVADFSFSNDWDDTVKVVAFFNKKGECPPQILKNGHSCMIPEEALIGSTFEICVLGKKQNMKLTTNKIKVVQNGG